MRSENEAIEEDMREQCFICSIDRDLIESAGISFRDHISSQHNMWAYHWFRCYLTSKDPLSFTGPEHYAFEMFKDRRNLTRFFPLKKSLIIERKNVELRSKSELDNLNGRVGSVEAQLAKLTAFVEKLAEQQGAQSGKLALEQHALAGTVGEAVEAIKAVHTMMQQQQQQKAAAETAAAARGRDTFLGKITLAQRERRKEQHAAAAGGLSATVAVPSSSSASSSSSEAPRASSPHWRAAKSSLAKARQQHQPPAPPQTGAGPHPAHPPPPPPIVTDEEKAKEKDGGGGGHTT